MYKKIIILTLALFALVGIQADNSKLSNMTKMLVNLNREAKTSSVNRLKLMGNVTPDNMVSAFVRVDGNYVAGTIERYGGVVRHHYESLGIMTIDLPVDALEALAAEGCILSIEVASPVYVQMDSARVTSHVEEMIAGKSPLGHGYMGDGVIVGVVDVDFQPGHINFYSSDQSRYRVRKFWNQNTGMVYSDSASIIAAGYDTIHIKNGHGTHVLGIAAGADHTHNYYGTAQNSDLLIVETKQTTADMAEGVREIFAYADSVGKPCVVNLSIGTNAGPHDGTCANAQILESLVGPGHLIVAAAGNSGDSPLHVGKTITIGDSLKTLLRFNFNSTDENYWTDMWGDADMDYRLRVGIYSATSNSIVYSTPYFNALLDSSYSVQLDTTFTGNSVKIGFNIQTQKNIKNDKGNILLTCTTDSIPDGFYVCLVAKGEPGTINMWTNDHNSAFTDLGMSDAGWSNGDAQMSIGSGIADAEKVITVGSYCSRTSSDKEQSGHLSSFSSRGPTVDNRTKPVITAPGSMIVSSISASPQLSLLGYQDSTTVGGKTYYYAYQSGTSMSSAYCTGVIAAWLEAKPDLTYDDVIEVFEHRAIQDQFTGSNLPDDSWGYGKLDAFNGLLYLLNLPPSGTENVTSSAKNKLFGYFDGMSAHLAGIAGDATIRVYDINGRLINTYIYESLTPGTEFTVNLGNQPAGVYVINVNGESLKVVR